MLAHSKVIEDPVYSDDNLSGNEGNVTIENETIQECKNNDSKQVISWSYDKTIALINSMSTHCSDFDHPKKRKHIFDHICNDLISQGFLATELMVQNKWKSLTRSYNKAKDTKIRTGQGPPRFMFFDTMDEILGNKPTQNCKHSLNSQNVESNSKKNNGEIPIKEKVGEIPIKENVEKQGRSSYQNVYNDDKNNNVEVQESSYQDVPAEPTTNAKNSRKRLSENKMKLELINLKTEEYKKRQKRHDEKIEIQKEKLKIEKKKLVLLEQYLRSREDSQY